MATETNALISVEQAVTDYLLGYKKTTEDYITYLRHALVLLTDFMIHDSQEARSEKLSIDSLGIIEFPTDMIRVKDVCVAWNGEWWTMTEKPNMINTTSFVGLVETHDSDFGEGVAIKDGTSTTFGSKGAINDYYYMVDYKARRIFIDGLVSDTCLVKYVSSGISASETTYIPILIVPMLESYLLWKESFWIPELVRERPMRQKDFENERLRVRNVLNSKTASQWKDIFWGSMSQSPKR
jgi:hypothetical protein